MSPLGSLVLALTLVGGSLDQFFVVEARVNVNSLTQETSLLGAPLTPTSLSRIGSSTFGERRGTRTTEVIIINTSNKNLTLRENWCEKGGYSEAFKPEITIPAKSSSVFGLEAGWLSRGIECTTGYVGDGVSVEIYTRNPYVGKNKADVSASGLKAVPTVTQGNVNEVRVIFS